MPVYVKPKPKEPLSLTRRPKTMDQEKWKKLRAFVLSMYKKDPAFKKMDKDLRRDAVSIVSSLAYLVDSYISKETYEYLSYMSGVHTKVRSDERYETAINRILSEFFKRQEEFLVGVKVWLHPPTPMITYRPHRSETRHTKNTFG